MSMKGYCCRGLAPIVFVAVLVSSCIEGQALAANGAVPRTPAVFHREACLSVVDRSADPMFRIDVSIPKEDTQLTADELPDSRTFQFFALCQDAHRAWSSLPSWVSLDDAQRALEHDPPIIDELPADEEFLQRHPVWSGCAHAINPADERLPIACDALHGGVVWNTSSVPVGNYVIRGYTFEPALNLWSARRGVVQVRDTEDPLPVASLMTPAVPNQKVSRSDGVRLQGCMDGPPGTLVHVAWANVLQLDVDEPADWHPIASMDATEQVIDLQFLPEDVADYTLLVFRARAVPPSPDASSFDAYAPGSVIVYPDGDSDPDDAPLGPDVCQFFDEDLGGTDTDTAGAQTDTAGAQTDTDATAPVAETTEPSGCHCNAGGTREIEGPFMLLLAFSAAARRRRASAPIG